MPVAEYSVLKGDPVSGQVVSGRSPHYRIAVNTDNGQVQVDINIQSIDGSEVLYVINQAFTPPSPDGLLALPTGLTALRSEPGGLALDFVRSQVNGQPMVTLAELSLLPIGMAAGDPGNGLNNAVVDMLNQAIADADGTLYAFGSAFANPAGIHNIHMNQGNPRAHARENGVWQDGAVFINLPAANRWMAIFIAFQTESWQTDDTTGNPD